MNLLTSIMICSMFYNSSIVNSMIQNGSAENPLMITVVTDSGKAGIKNGSFKTVPTALAYAKSQLAQGKHIEIGMMQIPSGWLETLDKQGVTLESLLRPCKNIAVASDLLDQAEAYCATSTNNDTERDTCALSFYKTGNKTEGLGYAKQIIDYATIHPFNKTNPSNQNLNYNKLLQHSEYQLPTPGFDQDYKDTDSYDTSSEGSDDNNSAK